MNLRKKMTNLVVAGAFIMSMTGGLVSAAQTDSADANLNVDCGATPSIDVNVYGQFQIDASSGASVYNASLPGGFEMVMDLSCNWSTNFQVSAQIGTFNYQGTAPANTVPSFGGGHLQLQDGSSVYTGPSGVLGIFPFFTYGAPDVSNTVFPGASSFDANAIEDGSFFPPFFVHASPGKTVATWNGELQYLPPNLAPGVYQGELTVVLTVN